MLWIWNSFANSTCVISAKSKCKQRLLRIFRSNCVIARNFCVGNCCWQCYLHCQHNFRWYKSVSICTPYFTHHKFAVSGGARRMWKESDSDSRQLALNLCERCKLLNCVSKCCWWPLEMFSVNLIEIITDINHSTDNPRHCTAHTDDRDVNAKLIIILYRSVATVQQRWWVYYIILKLIIRFIRLWLGISCLAQYTTLHWRSPRRSDVCVSYIVSVSHLHIAKLTRIKTDDDGIKFTRTARTQ